MPWRTFFSSVDSRGADPHHRSRIGGALQMNKVIITLVMALSMFIFGGATSASAEDCNVTYDPTCTVFQQQQNAPAYTGPQAPTTEPMRCVHVAAGNPSALVLRAGVGTSGGPFISWRASALQWTERYVNARKVMMTQICFPVRLLFAYDAVTLCGEVGHSIWRNQNMAFVRENNVDRFDPACVGGDGYCAQRGL